MSNWSQNIFLTVNKRVGRKPWLDQLMRFWAVWGIYILIAGLFIWSLMVLYSRASALWVQYIVMSILSFVIGLLISTVIGRLSPAKRPKYALPGSKELIQLRHFEYWKSFPSDHTMAAFTLVFIAMAFNVGALWAVLLLCVALSIGLARIYVGVHFPRDIFGGILVAASGALMSMQLFVLFLFSQVL